MAIDTLGDIVSVSGPKEPQHQVRPFRRRETPKPVDTAVPPDPVACANVVPVFRFVVACLFGLFRCEKPYWGSAIS